MVNDGEQALTIAPAAAVDSSAEPARHVGGGGGGGGGLAEESSDEDKGSQRFSDAEDHSWRSHSRQGSVALEDFISTCASVRSGAGASAGDADADGGGRRKSCVSECSLGDVDLEAGLAEISKASPDTAERNCRICHLGLESAAAESGSGMFLGCSCKDDLSCAHKQCAETWFKIRGNRICEICGSTACNVVGIGDAEFIEQWNESSNTAASQTPASEPRRFWQGHRFLNFLLACMVFAFVISWLFHFNVPG
uniref:RING-CH-type domain-containing protein n=1 Tax=Oryza glumipatula TaxID=40148 RepID=A0A0D9YHC3_9ORYZ